MADIDLEDPLLARIRARTNPLESLKDFQAYRGEELAYDARRAGDTMRKLIHLPPVSGGMTEIERNRLIKDYTGMLGALSKLETDLRSEEAKTARGRQTAWSNLSGQLLKYMASEDATRGGTVSSAHAGAETRMKDLGVQQEMRGLAGMDARIAKNYGPAIERLAGTVNPKTKEIVDRAGYTIQLEQLLMGVSDPRDIPGVLARVSKVSGKDATEFIEGIGTLYAADKATAAILIRRSAEGESALMEAAKQQTALMDESTKVAKTLDERAGGSPKYMQDLLKLAVLGSAGIEINDEKVAATFGLSPKAFALYKAGLGGDVGPAGTTSKTGGKSVMDPFLDDNRSRIIAEIDALRAGSSPRFVQIKKAMLASDAFQEFKRKTGISDNEVAFNTWADAARHHAVTSKRDSRIARERAILSGNELTDVGPLQVAGARVSSALRDLFGGKARKEEARLSDPSRADSIPPDDLADDPLLPEAADTPAPEKEVATKEEAVKATEPGAEPAASEENTSAAVTSGSSSSSSKVEAAGEAKPATEKTTEYRIVNDPRNMDYIYRQYADGRIELIGTPNDRTVSPKNPRAITRTDKTKMDSLLGAYEKPEEGAPAESTRDKLDLGDTDAATKAKSSLAPWEAAEEALDLSAIEGIARAGSGEIKLGKSGPGVKLGKDGELQKVAVEKPKDTEPEEIKGEVKGSLDNTSARVDALVKTPTVDRKEALKPVEVVSSTDAAAEKMSGGNMNPLMGDLSPEEKARRAKMRAALSQVTPEESE
jgi:hypothetical protein